MRRRPKEDEAGGGGGETVAIQGDDDHDDECGGLHNGGRVRGFQASSPGLNISPLHGHGAMPWSHSLQTGVEKGQRETPRMTGPLLWSHATRTMLHLHLQEADKEDHTIFLQSSHSPFTSV